MTNEEFDKIYESFDMEKIDLKSMVFPKEELDEFKSTLDKWDKEYDEKIKKVEEEIKQGSNSNSSEQSQTNNSVNIQDILNDENDDEIDFDKYIKKGILDMKTDIEDGINNINNNLKQKKQKREEDEEIKKIERENEENRNKTLVGYLNYLKDAKEKFRGVHSYFSNYIDRLLKKEKDFYDKIEKLENAKDSNYEKYKKECERIKARVKNNLDNIRNMFTYDKECEINKGKKKYDDKEEKLASETNDIYFDLKNRQPVIKKFYRISIGAAIFGGIICASTALFTGGASLAVGMSFLFGGMWTFASQGIYEECKGVQFAGVKF